MAPITNAEPGTGRAALPLTPREWVADGVFPWPPIHALQDNDPVVACFYVQVAQLALTRQEKPYLRLQLSDRHGAVEARVWEDAERCAAIAREGGFVGIRGRVETYNGKRQLRVDQVAPIRVGPGDLELFMPRSNRAPEEMERELQGLLASIGDRPLRSLLERILDPATETGQRFRHAPAAKHNHHAYVGGLLEHTLSVAALCDFLARHYGALVDRDLLLAGALLHDIGKVREIGIQPGFAYTDEGKLLGHILLGLQIVSDAAQQVPELPEERLLLLRHLIASHQGKYEWQSPREPRTLEALLLHHADDLDAKANQVMSLLRDVDRGWTEYDRAFSREFFRHRRSDEVPDAEPISEALVEEPAEARAGQETLDLFS